MYFVFLQIIAYDNNNCNKDLDTNNNNRDRLIENIIKIDQLQNFLHNSLEDKRSTHFFGVFEISLLLKDLFFEIVLG